MADTGTSAAAPLMRRREIALWVAVTGLLALAVSPVLTRSHVEGFTYFTETLSILLPDLSHADPLWSLTRGFLLLVAARRDLGYGAAVRPVARECL